MTLRAVGEAEYNVQPSDQAAAVCLASALYASRGDLVDLHRFSVEPQQVGSLFIGVFGRRYGTLVARAPEDAAASLCRSIADQLGRLELSDPAEDALCKRVVPAQRAAARRARTDPFRVLFEDVVLRVAPLFGASWPPVRLVIEAIGNPPLQTERFWVNAATDQHLDRASAPVTVHLRVNPQRLNFETYGAIYAVLVHECVCHVAAHREPPNNSSPFAEGLADWAGVQLFDRWLNDPGGDAELRRAASHFGRELWRLTLTMGGGNALWHARELGHAAGDALVARLRAAGLAPSLALDRAIALVLELIPCAVPLWRKDNLTRLLASLPTTVRFPAIDTWVASRDIADLLQSPAF